MNNLIISFDLMQPGQNYQTMEKAIKSLGLWAKVNQTVWFVKSNHNCMDALNKLKSVSDHNDKIFVVDAKNNSAAWNNLASEVAEYIHSEWQN